MNIYTRISKELGFEGTAYIPTPEEAARLLGQVMTHKSEEAFKEVFRIVRFSPSPQLPEQRAAMELIMMAFASGSIYFKSKPI